MRHEIDGVSFRLKKFHDFSWIRKYGTAFSAIDATGSGCISFGVADGVKRYFVKIAGADTMDAEISPEESVRLLKDAAGMYEILKHPNLVELIEHYALEDYYVAVFRWADGDCLFDYWNFGKYGGILSPLSPASRFKSLPARQKLSAVEAMFSFLETVAARHYVAVDFYDGSLIYDFKSQQMTICDIDLFRRQPAVNDIGEDYWGPKRFKAPEEYVLGAVIDESTNVFTLGALIFDFFGIYTQEEIGERYTFCRFLPCAPEKWTLNEASYLAALRAVNPDREQRYGTVSEFHKAFYNVL